MKPDKKDHISYGPNYKKCKDGKNPQEVLIFIMTVRSFDLRGFLKKYCTNCFFKQ